MSKHHANEQKQEASGNRTVIKTWTAHLANLRQFSYLSRRNGLGKQSATRQSSCLGFGDSRARS